MLKEIKGNLFLSDITSICHGCNTHGLMGAGIARQFAQRYPKMVVEYQKLCRTGNFQIGDCYLYEAGDGRIIGNLGTQEKPGAHARLEAIELSLEKFIISLNSFGYKELAMPKIGCGIGGLEWIDVCPLVEKLAEKYSFDIVVYYI